MDLTTKEQIRELASRIIRLWPIDRQSPSLFAQVEQTIETFAGKPREFRQESVYQVSCVCGAAIVSNSAGGYCAKCGRGYQISR